MAKFAFLLWAAFTVQEAMSEFDCKKYGQDSPKKANCENGECTAKICCDLEAKTCGRFREVNDKTCADGQFYRPASTETDSESDFEKDCCAADAATATETTTAAATTDATNTTNATNATTTAAPAATTEVVEGLFGCHQYTADDVDTIDDDAAVESGRTFVFSATLLFLLLQS